jgi:hypothetical protein
VKSGETSARARVEEVEAVAEQTRARRVCRVGFNRLKNSPTAACHAGRSPEQGCSLRRLSRKQTQAKIASAKAAVPKTTLVEKGHADLESARRS